MFCIICKALSMQSHAAGLKPGTPEAIGVNAFVGATAAALSERIFYVVNDMCDQHGQAVVDALAHIAGLDLTRGDGKLNEAIEKALVCPCEECMAKRAKAAS